MTAAQERDSRFHLSWALVDDEPVEPTVVDLRDAEIEMDRQQRCPACQAHALEAATIPSGARYEHCLNCDRVWEVSDGRLSLVIEARIRTRALGDLAGPRGAAPAEPVSAVWRPKE